MRAFLVLISFLTLSFSAMAADTLHWNADRPLKWTDFQGRPNLMTDAVAQTASGIRYEGTWDGNGNYGFKIIASFDKNESWVKMQGIHETTLKHEQNHFDLTEIYARRIINRINLISVIPTKTMVREIFDRFTKELNETQLAYDRETTHGTNPEQQVIWNKKIAAWLQQ